MKKYPGSLILVFILFFLSCKGVKKNTSAVNEKKATAKPNVIIILADDAGYIDFGFMGSKDLETPEIDKLAKEGIIFTDAHVSSTVCAPSRAGLMTGQYQQRFGFEANGTGGIGLSDDVQTMGDVFKAQGYNTYALGKWHLGDGSDHPNKRGFDEFYGFLTGSRSYFPIKNPSKDKMLQHNGERVEFTGYMTDVLGNQSVRFVEQSKNKPFLMYLAYNAVHTPMEAKKEDLEKFKNHPRQKLAAMTWSLDENVGKLINKLEELGLRENTLIYFLSDNGGSPENTSLNGPLKGWKGKEFEGGHRVPFVLSWPQGLKGGTEFGGLTSSFDIFTTSMAAAGITKPDNITLDGANLLPYLRGELQGDPHQSLFWRKLDKSAARLSDYKIVTLDGYGSVLYDLDKDLGETNDLSKSRPADFERVINSYKNWEKKLMPPLWDEGKQWMDFSAEIHRYLMENKEPPYRSLYEKKRYLKAQNQE